MTWDSCLISRRLSKSALRIDKLFSSRLLCYNIVSLADNILTNPKRVQIKAVAPADTVTKEFTTCVKAIEDLLIDILSTDDVQTFIFTRTKFGADKVVRYLKNSNIRAEAIHGNKSQPARENLSEEVHKVT